MIELLKVAEEVLEKASHKIHAQKVTARLEVSPLTKAHALLDKGAKEVKRDESIMKTVNGKLQFCIFVENVAATCTRERAKVTRKKAGLSTLWWCPRIVQSPATPFLNEV